MRMCSGKTFISDKSICTQTKARRYTIQ